VSNPVRAAVASLTAPTQGCVSQPDLTVPDGDDASSGKIGGRGTSDKGGAPSRYPALDALRGVAATCVVFHHLVIRWPANVPTLLPHSLAYVAQGLGHPSVVLFFVLSGFVLTLSHHTRRTMAYGHFVLLRISRLYPAYYAALALMVACVWIAQGPIGTFDIPAILRSLSLVATNNSDISADPVIWSLVHEMRFSLAFPFLMMILLRSGTAFLVVATLLAIVPDLMLRAHGLAPDYLLMDEAGLNACITTLYFGSFMVGMYAATVRLARDRAWRLGTAAALGVTGAAILVVLLRPVVKIDFVLAVPLAGVMLIATTDSVLSRVLCQPFLQWLGRISYSLYLVHLPLMAMVATLGGFAGSRFGYPIVAIIVSFAVAELFQRFVEAPGTAYGKRFARFLSGPA
jgi:peptidoglycan/LPS O-acetylase OafA/YrhL